MANPTREEVQRDTYPHMEAVAARWMWGAKYAAQRGGTMTFYDRLSAREKRLVKEMVDQILAAPLGRAK